MFDSRKHVVLRVYTQNERGDDLLFIAHVAMDLKNGKHVAGEFTARVEVADADSESPRLKSYSIWAVSFLYHYSRVHDCRFFLSVFWCLWEANADPT